MKRYEMKKNSDSNKEKIKVNNLVNNLRRGKYKHIDFCKCGRPHYSKGMCRICYQAHWNRIVVRPRNEYLKTVPPESIIRLVRKNGK